MALNWGCAPQAQLAGMTKPEGPDKAMAERWRELAKETADLPAAREVLNHSRPPENMVNVARLAGEAPATRDQLAWARNYISGQIEQLSQAKDWPEAKAYTIQKAGRVVTGNVIDDAPLWASAQIIAINYPARESKTAPVGAVCQMLWDAEALHVLYKVPDKQIISPYTKRDELLSDSDCVELFILADYKKPEYWEFNYSPNGVVYDTLNTKYPDQWSADRIMVGDAKSMRVYTKLTGEGYCVQVSIPWAEVPQLKLPVGPGTQVWMLAGWVDKNMDINAGVPIYYSHTPVLAWFHNIWGYSRFTLGE